MNIIAICALAVTAAIITVTLRPKNGEIAVMLALSCSAVVLLSLFSQASAVVSAVNSIVAACGMSSDCVVIMLKAAGICVLTEFASNACRDAGSASLACNVTLAGKIMVTFTALPLYTEILNTVLSLVSSG